MRLFWSVIGPVSATLVVLHATAAQAPASAPEVGRPTARPAVSWKAECGQPGDRGEPFLFEGRVVRADGRSVKDARVYAYHAAPSGRYERRTDGWPAFEAVMRTQALGAFRLRTLLPGTAEGNAHLHFEIAVGPDSAQRFTVNLFRAHGAGSDRAFGTLVQLTNPNPGKFGAFVERNADGLLVAHKDLVLEDGAPGPLSPDVRRAFRR